MPSASEIKARVALETERRSRLGVPTLAGGVLYLLSGIIISSTLKGAPSVGLFQGLAPAIRGVANPSESARAAEVRFVSHHAFGLITGSVLAAASIAALTLTLLLLLNATRFRRSNTWSGLFPLVAGGGIALALVSIGRQVLSAIEAHTFAVGHDFSRHAVDNALKYGATNEVFQYLALLAGLAFAGGMIAVCLNALRVGLLPRWMGFLGMLTAVLILLPTAAQFEVVPAFWMVMMGILYLGRWPNGEPPAWADGEARPWPSQAAARAARRVGAGQPALSMAGADVAPAPAQPVPKGSRKRRRKRGARG
jgi:hypothetical protein